MTVTKAVIVETPCLAKPPPLLGEVLRREECPDGLELCLDKESTFALNEYLADLISYANSAWEHCKEDIDDDTNQN